MMTTHELPVQLDAPVRTLDARRTFRSTPMRAWLLLAAPSGAGAWLGEAPSGWWQHPADPGPQVGDVLSTAGGAAWAVEEVEAERCIVLRQVDVPAPTTMSLWLTPERGRTVIELRWAGMADELQEPRIREQLQDALDRIEHLLDAA